MRPSPTRQTGYRSDATDDQPVEAIVLLLTTPGKVGNHHALISPVARWCREPQVLDRLQATTTRSEYLLWIGRRPPSEPYLTPIVKTEVR